jgi:glycosyltransferase involved in cell wall biosynthesis
MLQTGRAAHAHVHGIVKGLRENGYDVKLIARDAPLNQRRKWWARLPAIVTLSAQALVHIRRADVLYIRSHPLAYPLAKVARWRRLPTVHEVNGRMDDLAVTYRLLAPIANALLQLQHRQYADAAGLVAVTPGLVGWLSSLVGVNSKRTKLAMIPNGADSSTFRPDAQGGPRLARPYVLFFGALNAWHGVDVMLAALGSPVWPTTVDLVIVGQGAEQAKLERVAAMDARLRLLGNQDDTATAGLCARAIASLVPITGHGGRDDYGVAPIKLYESMASGRPVIASNLPYQRDIVRQCACGITFDLAEPDAIAKAVRVLHDNPGHANELGANGRRAIEIEGDWTHRADATAQFIKSILHERLNR